MSVFTTIKFLPILACFSSLSVFVFGRCVLLYLLLRVVTTYYINNIKILTNILYKTMWILYRSISKLSFDSWFNSQLFVQESSIENCEALMGNQIFCDRWYRLLFLHNEHSSQARIHNGFHHFAKVCSISHNKYI